MWVEGLLREAIPPEPSSSPSRESCRVSSCALTDPLARGLVWVIPSPWQGEEWNDGRTLWYLIFAAKLCRQGSVTRHVFCRISSLFCCWWLMPALKCFVSLQRCSSVVRDQYHCGADQCHAHEINMAQVGKTGLFYTECQVCSCHSDFLPLETRLRNCARPTLFATRHQKEMAWPGPLEAMTADGLEMAICGRCKYINSFLQNCPAWHQGYCSFEGGPLEFFALLRNL